MSLPPRSESPYAILRKELIRRANKLKIYAYFSLFLILVSLGSGVWLFVEAGGLAEGSITDALIQLEQPLINLSAATSQISGKLNEAKDQNDQVLSGLRTISEPAANFDQEIANKFDILMNRIDQFLEDHRENLRVSSLIVQDEEIKEEVISILELIRNQIVGISSLIHSEEEGSPRSLLTISANKFQESISKTLEMYGNDLQIRIRDIESITNPLNSIEENLQEISTKFADGVNILDGGGNRLSYEIILREAMIRAGAIIILLFLVQILSNLYRYNIRLASFYDARADALLLIEFNAEQNFEKAVEILAPDQLDFGKQAKIPADHVVQLAKELIGRTKPESTESQQNKTD